MNFLSYYLLMIFIVGSSMALNADQQADFQAEQRRLEEIQQAQKIQDKKLEEIHQETKRIDQDRYNRQLEQKRQDEARQRHKLTAKRWNYDHSRE